MIAEQRVQPRRSPVAPARSLRKYLSVTHLELLNSLAYPVDLLMRSITICLFVFVFSRLWIATYGALGGRALAGLTARDAVWYLMLAEVVMLSTPRVSTTVSTSVKDGSIAYSLCRPYSLVGFLLASSVGEGLLAAAVNLLAGGTVAWLTAGPPPWLASWPFAALAVAAAWLINFSISALIGLSAFLVEEVSPFEWIHNKFVLVLGGLLLPVDFFPHWLRTISLALPFAYVTYAPARIFVSHHPSQVLWLLAGQGVWLAVFACLLPLAYKLAVRRLTINGG